MNRLLPTISIPPPQLTHPSCPSSKLVVLGPGELVMRYEPVLVLVLVLEYLLDKLLVVGHHLLDVITALRALSRCHLFFQIFANLVPGQLFVLVLVDLFEHVCGGCLVANVQQFDVEHQSGSYLYIQYI